MTRKVRKTHDFGGGFYVQTEPRSNWTAYIAVQLDSPDGYVVNKRLFETCYRREAEAKIKEWQQTDMRNMMRKELSPENHIKSWGILTALQLKNEMKRLVSMDMSDLQNENFATLKKWLAEFEEISDIANQNNLNLNGWAKNNAGIKRKGD